MQVNSQPQAYPKADALSAPDLIATSPPSIVASRPPVEAKMSRYDYPLSQRISETTKCASMASCLPVWAATTLEVGVLNKCEGEPFMQRRNTFPCSPSFFCVMATCQPVSMAAYALSAALAIPVVGTALAVAPCLPDDTIDFCKNQVNSFN